jgi:hypothetical protein
LSLLGEDYGFPRHSRRPLSDWLAQLALIVIGSTANTEANTDSRPNFCSEAWAYVPVPLLLVGRVGLAGYLAYLGRRADAARRSFQRPVTGKAAQTLRLPASPTPPQPGPAGGYEPAA